MTKDEVLEEIRELLQEALLDTVENPWRYSDEELERSIRSALRFLRVCGVSTTATMGEDGAFSTDPSEDVGLLISYRVSSNLLRGDLSKKLTDGEMGLVFRMGPDMIDTKTAAIGLGSVAEDYEAEFAKLIARVITTQYNDASLSFGGPTPAFEQ